MYNRSGDLLDATLKAGRSPARMLSLFRVQYCHSRMNVRLHGAMTELLMPSWQLQGRFARGLQASPKSCQVNTSRANRGRRPAAEEAGAQNLPIPSWEGSVDPSNPDDRELCINQGRRLRCAGRGPGLPSCSRASLAARYCRLPGRAGCRDGDVHGDAIAEVLVRSETRAGRERGAALGDGGHCWLMWPERIIGQAASFTSSKLMGVDGAAYGIANCSGVVGRSGELANCKRK